MQSLVIVVLTSLFTGMVISLESAQQAVPYGFGNLVGGAVAYASVRELGPMLTGVVVAGRVGAAIAAEIGSMVVTEQIEALRSMGLEPARFLVVPRFIAMLIMLPLLTIFADVVSIAGGAWIAQTYAHISYDSFLASVRQTIDFRGRRQGAAQGGRLWRDHRDRRRLSRALDARRRGRRRQVDDRSGRDLDHFDLYVELRALAASVRLTVHGNGKAIARIENASLAFGDRVVLKNCSLDIVEGAITCIIGLSGAGKSTILRLLDGLLLPQEGHVYVRGQDICHMNEDQRNVVRRKISLSFQFSALLDSLTVGENVALPLREHTKLSRGRDPAHRHGRARQRGARQKPTTICPPSSPAACSSAPALRAPS